MLFFLLLQSVGWSALFYAAKDGHLEIARLLVSAGANTLLRDKVLKMLNRHANHSFLLPIVEWNGNDYSCLYNVMISFRGSPF